MAAVLPTKQPSAWHPTQQINTLLRALTLLCLLVFSGQTLLPVVHKVLVRHRVCAVHGVWEHVDEGAPAQHALSGSLGYAPGESPHEHEPCDACANASHQPALVTARPASERLVMAQATVETLAAGVFVQNGVGRYRVAPKQGPPTRA